MRVTKAIAFCAPALLLGFSGPLPAQTPKDCANSPFTGCTVGEVYNALTNELHDKQISKVSAAFAPEVDQEMTDEENVATTAPDPFAGRIHSSYQSFLNLLGFAVNKVDESEDGQAFIVRFNPLRQGLNLLGLTVTVSKPAVAEKVTEAIPLDKRSSIVDEIQKKKIDDLEDLTGAVSYSRETAKCGWAADVRCWGRSYKPYRQMMAEVLKELVPPPTSEGQQKALVAIAGKIPGPTPFDTPISALGPQTQDVVKLLQDLAAETAPAQDDMKNAVKSGIGNLPALVENQPQLTGTVSYRDPGHYGGQNELAASLELLFGRQNVNTLARECAADLVPAKCFYTKLKALDPNTISTAKGVLTASFKQFSKYRLPGLGLASEVEGFTPVDLKSSSEIKVKGQYGWELKPQLGGKLSRLDFALDGIRTMNDHIRTQNRLVATATLTLPFGDQMSMPISVMYANKPEFLKDATRQIGMHLGLTYRPPWGTRTAAN